MSEITLQNYVEILGEPVDTFDNYEVGIQCHMWIGNLTVWARDQKVIKVSAPPDYYVEKLLDTLTDLQKRERFLFNLNLFNDYEIQND